MLFLMTYSYTRSSVSRKQNWEWLSQGSTLQVTYLSYSAQMTLMEDLHLKIDWYNHDYWLIIQVLHGLHKNFSSQVKKNYFLNSRFMENKISLSRITRLYTSRSTPQGVPHPLFGPSPLEQYDKHPVLYMEVLQDFFGLDGGQ